MAFLKKRKCFLNLKCFLKPKCFLNPKEYYQQIQLMSDYENDTESSLNWERAVEVTLARRADREWVSQRSRQKYYDAILCPVSY